MDAKTLLDNFEVVADGPAGIQRLRNLVLDLAVRGQLVAQDPSDEPAAALLGTIKVIRDKMITAGMVPRPKRLEQPLPQLPWFDLPESWRWASVEEVSVYVQRGKSPRYSDTPTSVHVISQKCIKWTGFDPGPARDVDENAVRTYGPERFLRADDLLFNSTGTGTVGRVALFSWPQVNERVVADSHVTVVRLARCNARFVHAWLSSVHIQSRINALTSGTTQQQELNASTVRGVPVPLPPRAEQDRIVAKIDELMELCDELERRQKGRNRANIRARTAVLHALTHADTTDDLGPAWERVSSNLDAVIDTAEAINELRQAIVQLAVEGRLVPQCDDDPHAEEILAAADHEKQQLIFNGTAQRRAILGPIEPDEFQAALPKGWALERLDRWCDVAGGVAKGRSLVGRDICTLPYLRVANVKAGHLELDEVKTIEIGVDEIARYSLRAGDVLLTEGGDWDKLGRSAVWTGEIDPCLHQNHVFRARCLSDRLLPWWVSLYTNSAVGRKYFQSKAKRTTNLASINMTELRSMPLPVPPFEEQLRIAARVAALMSLCDELQGQFDDQLRAQSALAARLTQVD